MRKALARGLSERLEEYGLSFMEAVDLTELGDWDTLEATMRQTHGPSRTRYRVVYSSSQTEAALRSSGVQDDPRRLLIVGPRVTERSAERFRAAGVNYLDQAGNAFIAFDGVRIDVRGRRPDPKLAAEPGVGTSARGAGLFSTKRSQVVFSILSWEELLWGTVREIARTAGVSIGQAQATLDLLRQGGFLDRRGWASPRERDRLIDQWTAAYPLGLGAAAAAQPFSGDFTDLHATRIPVYVSGGAAVPEVLRRPESVVLYSAEVPVELIRKGRWRRDEESPNIFLRQQFWSPPEPEVPGSHRAPWLLVYGDLMASNDSRLREAAQELRGSR
jgi:hypothetical protein